MSERYDSRPDTHEHIGQVQGLLLGVAADLAGRAHRHDASKLVEPEVSVFDEFTPKLRDSTYVDRVVEEAPLSSWRCCATGSPAPRPCP